jgi:uncharacterized protein YcbX
VHVKELWRYPVKSLAGEQIKEARIDQLGVGGDRQILVHDQRGKVITSRTHHKLLGLKGTTDSEGAVFISGHPWNSTEALGLIREAAGPTAELSRHEGPERFDVLPLLVATDGAIDHMRFDRRRFRPNILIGGVEGLAERTWPGRRLRIGDVVIYMSQLRGRCVMTTYDPDTLQQDLNVLKRVVKELQGKLALDSSIESSGLIRVGDPVVLLQ